MICAVGVLRTRYPTRVLLGVCAVWNAWFGRGRSGGVNQQLISTTSWGLGNVHQRLDGLRPRRRVPLMSEGVSRSRRRGGSILKALGAWHWSVLTATERRSKATCSFQAEQSANGSASAVAGYRFHCCRGSAMRVVDTSWTLCKLLPACLQAPFLNTHSTRPTRGTEPR